MNIRRWIAILHTNITMLLRNPSIYLQNLTMVSSNIAALLRNAARILRRYSHLFLVFCRNSLAGQLEYRINFISGLLVECGFIVAKLTYVLLIYQTGVSIHGMTPDYMLIFIGTYTLMTGFYMAIYSNLVNIAGYVRDGTLDLLMTKPVSLLFITSFRYIDFAMPIPSGIAGLAMIVIGWKRCHFMVNGLTVGGFLLFLVLGCILTYAIFLLPRLLSFWIIASNGISQMCDSAWNFNNMPMGIYNRWIQGIGSFLFPIFLITNLPGMFLGGMPVIYVLWGILAPFLFLTLSILIWSYAVKRYTSAA